MVHTLAVFLTSPQGLLAIIGALALVCLVLLLSRNHEARRFHQHSRPTPLTHVPHCPVHIPPFTVDVEKVIW